jgi:hypothetical protein
MTTNHLPGGKPGSVLIAQLRRTIWHLTTSRRQAYKIAEDVDLEGWVAAFTDDGTFTDESIGVTWTGPAELPEQVQNYARAVRRQHGS